MSSNDVTRKIRRQPKPGRKRLLPTDPIRYVTIGGNYNYIIDELLLMDFVALNPDPVDFATTLASFFEPIWRRKGFSGADEDIELMNAIALETCGHYGCSMVDFVVRSFTATFQKRRAYAKARARRARAQSLRCQSAEIEDTGAQTDSGSSKK